MNMFEQAKMSNETAALVAVLRESGISASMAREAVEADWRTAAGMARCQMPSAQTIALVIEALAELEGAGVVKESLTTEPEPVPAQQEADQAACPYCSEVGGKPVFYDFGVEPETGYHDAGERCTLCAPSQPPRK